MLQNNFNFRTVLSAGCFVVLSFSMLWGCAQKSPVITEQVAPDIYRIKVSRSNIYLIVGKTLALIDTGMPGDGAEVIKAIDALGRNPKEVSHILITHGHIDHAGSLALLKKSTGAEVVAGAGDIDYIQGKKKLWRMGREGFGGKLFKIVLFFAETFVFTYEPTTVDQVCSGGEVIDFNGDITVVATPGHSLGSVSYYLPDKHILFTGDALSGEPHAKLPPRAGCADYQQALASVKTLASLQFNICCFGHGKPVAKGADVLVRKLLVDSP